MKKINVGVIGCGDISGIYLQNGTQVFDVLNIVACADLMEDRAKSRAEEFGIEAVTPDELLQRDDIDVILNLTVPMAHAEVSLKALENGKHVYSEKTLAVTREDGKKIINLARKKGLKVGCAPDTFLGAGLQTSRKLLDDGWIGKPVGAIAFMVACGPETFHPNPGLFYRKGAGPLLDMGPYYATALVSHLGAAKRVTGIATMPYKEKVITAESRYGEIMPIETPTYVNGTIEFANGVCANLITTFDMHYRNWESGLPFLQIFGSEGTLSLTDPNFFGGSVKVRRFNGEFTEVPLTHGFTENSRSIGLADMAVSILTGSDKHRVNGDMAYHVLEILTGILTSSETNRHYQMESSCELPEPMPQVTLRNSTLPKGQTL